MTVLNILTLLGGLALFLYGMHVMGDGLTKCSGSALKNTLAKVTNNPIIGFIVGVLVTAVIQSSTATIVLVVGLVGAGIISFRQSISVVLGANVGTTVTAQIIRLLDINGNGSVVLDILKPSGLAPIAAVIGIILIMFIKKNKTVNHIGEIAMGFGVLFIGLINMTSAVSPLSESETFKNILQEFSKTPILGFLSGVVITAIMQSSSATIGMLQALCTTGALTFSSTYAIVIGVNIGTCVTTALVTSIGTKAEARRTGMVHIVFNVIGSILIVIFIIIAKSCGWLDKLWDTTLTSGMLANVHTVFKLIEAVLLLPFVKVLEKITYVLVKDDKKIETEADKKIALLDNNLLLSVPMALKSVREVLKTMGTTSIENIKNAFNLFGAFSDEKVNIINENELTVDKMSDAVENYLIKVSSNVDNEHNNDRINFCIQCSSEFERIGDHATDISENAVKLNENKLAFSETATKELEILSNAVITICEYAYKAFENVDVDTARKVEPLEEVIDDMVEMLKNRHIERLKRGECAVYSGIIFLDILSHAERTADQCSNIAIAVLSQYDKSIMESHHDYVSNLHKSNDPIFTTEYKKNKDYYYNALKALYEDGAAI